jgi:class 3 adenylate cyclase
VHRAEILATEAVLSALDPRFQTRPLAPTALQGVAEPVATWAIIGFDGERR